MDVLPLIGIVVGLWILGCIVGLPIIALMQSRKIARLTARLEDLEHKRLPAETPSETFMPVAAEESPIVAALVESEAPTAEGQGGAPAPARAKAAIGSGTESVEAWIGQKALGWIAVVLMLFATAFFLKHAFENDWIGPMGRVAVGVAAGLGLCLGGMRYDRKGWRRFGQMLSAGGVVLLYLSTFGAFGYYHLLPQQHAAIFLVVLILETAALAVLYEAPAIALMAVIGALLTPVLLHTDRDQFRSLFLYLTAVNLGVLGIASLRRWPLIGSVGLLGTQLIFWAWHAENYHPEKLAWALGFQAAIFVVYLLYGAVRHVFRRYAATIEDLLRMLVSAGLFFGAAYVLLDADYHLWMGSFAVAMAAIYAAWAWLTLWRNAEDQRQVMFAIAIAAGFVAIAIPLQAEVRWIAVGWALQGLLLWWFGCRVQMGFLRAIGAALLLMGVGRLLFINTPSAHHGPFMPIFNGYCLTALLVAASVFGVAAIVRRFRDRLTSADRAFQVLAVLGGIAIVWLLISVETYDYFQQSIIAQRGRLAAHYGAEGYDAQGRPMSQVVYEATDAMHRTAVMALSVAWAVYATVILAFGFAMRSAATRSAALLVFAVTLGKVLLVDMADLPGFYRVGALFALAVMMAVAAWAYQRAHFSHKSKVERT